MRLKGENLRSESAVVVEFGHLSILRRSESDIGIIWFVEDLRTTRDFGGE